MAGISQVLTDLYLISSPTMDHKDGSSRSLPSGDYPDAPHQIEKHIRRQIKSADILNHDPSISGSGSGSTDGSKSENESESESENENENENEHISQINNQFINSNNTDVIVYLAQFGQHSSYGVQYDENKHILTGLSKLISSLDKLYANYAYSFPNNLDVIIFYDYLNPPTQQQMRLLSLNHDHPKLKFRELNSAWWSIPPGVHRVKRANFSMGYRHMMQWFAVKIWPYLANEGYTHVMRMDDDSYIHSRITYNLFDYMRENGKRYGFRQPVIDPVAGKGYNELVDQYLLDYPNSTTQTLIDNYKQNRGIGFYNNWFIADISFFLSEPASTLLERIDDSRSIYIERTGDLIVHSTLVRLFLQPKQIQWFRDFTYEHMTLCGLDSCRGCPQTGGVSRGINATTTDEEWELFAQGVKDRFKGNDKCRTKKFSSTNVFVGAGGIGNCENLDSGCGYYLKLLVDADGGGNGNIRVIKKLTLQ